VDVGDLELARKEYAKANTSYRRAIAGYEDVLGKSDARLGFPLVRLGEAELRAGHPELAIAPLERAHSIYAAASVPAVVAAEANFPSARALWSQPADRTRARELAKSARDTFATGGSSHTTMLGEANTWLLANAVKPR
jgi:hypothetical protein